MIDNAIVREFDVQDKQGRWYSLRIRPYRTLENKIDGAVLVLVDIDSQKRIESQLRTTDERYRLLMENAEGLAIILLDEQGKVTGWNSGAQRIFGYVASEIEGQHVSRFFLPEDLTNGRLEKELEAARDQRASEDDNWLMRKDGSRFWANGMTTALRDDVGDLRGYAKVIRALTQKRRFERALSESEERFSALFDRGAIGIEQVAANGRLMLVNQYLCDLLGYQSDELTGTDAIRLIHPDDRQADADKARQLLTGKIDAYSLLKRYLAKDGRAVPTLCSSTVVHDESGNVKYRLSIVQEPSGAK